MGNFGLKALNIAQNTVEYFKEYFYRPYITFADCAYSNYSAEELNKWTQDLVLQYKNKLNKTADIGNRIGGDLSIVEEKEIELTLDDIHDTNVNQISYFIHHNLDKSFSVDSMKYYLQRFILPGVINAIIGEKLDLVTNWLDPSSMQLIRQFSAAQAQLKRNPFIYHIIDVSDPIGIKQNGEYHLMFTFSLVYCFQYKDGEKTKVIDKRISLEMKAERDEYPDSPLSWKIIQPAHLLYLLSDPEAQEI